MLQNSQTNAFKFLGFQGFQIPMFLRSVPNSNDLNLVINNLFFRNRVAVQLQKNLDRVRLRRIATKLKNATHGGVVISSHPSGMLICTKNILQESDDEEESSR